MIRYKTILTKSEVRDALSRMRDIFHITWIGKNKLIVRKKGQRIGLGRLPINVNIKCKVITDGSRTEIFVSQGSSMRLTDTIIFAAITLLVVVFAESIIGEPLYTNSFMRLGVIGSITFFAYVNAEVFSRCTALGKNIYYDVVSILIRNLHLEEIA